MKGKLIKQNGIGFQTLDGVDYYLILDAKIYHTNPLTHGLVNGGKLSKQNCDEIFGVIDVEKLADEFVNDLQVASETVNRAVKLGYEEGFNKAMELNKDKLFTLEDMRTMMVIGAACEREKGDFTFEFESYTNHLLTEVEVEIEMVCEIGCVYFVFNGEKSMCCGNKVPKLDENGCLILKKK